MPDGTANPAALVLARTTGACEGDGCLPRDPGEIDTCALGTTPCSEFGVCYQSGFNQGDCYCNDGYSGDGYVCEADPVEPDGGG